MRGMEAEAARRDAREETDRKDLARKEGEAHAARVAAEERARREGARVVEMEGEMVRMRVAEQEQRVKGAQVPAAPLRRGEVASERDPRSAVHLVRSTYRHKWIPLSHQPLAASCPRGGGGPGVAVSSANGCGRTGKTWRGDATVATSTLSKERPT